MRHLVLCLLLPAVACRRPTVSCADADADGWCSEEDCADDDRAIHPDAEEVCDGLDNDCDGDVDGGLGDPWYRDADGDGFGDPDPSTTVTACTAPVGYATDTTDCDDGASDVHPGAPDACGDGIDADCDGHDAACDYLTSRRLDEAHARYYGERSGDRAGSELAFGDVNGDGLEDLWVAARERSAYHTADGSAYLLYGPITGSHSLEEAPMVLSGEDAEYEIGRSVAMADLNGDGFDDPVAGAPHSYTYGGGAFALYGPVTGIFLTYHADVQVRDPIMDDHFGHGVSAGDFDGDGHDDLAIGAYLSDAAWTDGGAVYVYRGPLEGDLDLTHADSLWTGEDYGNTAGEYMYAGEVTCDGLSDILVTSSNNHGGPPIGGVVWVVSDPVPGTFSLSAATARYTGGSASAYAGSSVAGADVDGDGCGDLIVGAFGDNLGGSAAGAAFILAGPVSGEHDLTTGAAILVGPQPGGYAGWSVAAADADRDGYADVAVGAITEPINRGTPGAAYFVQGPVSGTFDLEDATAILAGEGTGDYAGSSVGFGDMNGDGTLDLGVGAEYNTNGRTQGGAVYLLYGGIEM